MRVTAKLSAHSSESHETEPLTSVQQKEVEGSVQPSDQQPLSGKQTEEKLQAGQASNPAPKKAVADHPVNGWIAAINRPWLLLTIPSVVGSIWLANNSWVITNNLDKPYALAAGPALVASVVVGWLIINFFKSIASWCKSAWQAFQQQRKEDGSAQFFWIVIIVFMIVSVFASGTFFNTLEHNALPGLGYVTALFIDLVAVQAMRARLNAVRMRDKKGASLYLFGVLLCAGASAFANVYTSLADFNQHLSGALPAWMLLLAPWFGLVFPALILLLSMTADYTIDQISTQLDPEQYKAQETKRIKLLEYQRDGLRERVVLEGEIDRYMSLLHAKKERRTFFLVNWLFPLRQSSTIQPDINAQKITDEVVNTLRPWFQFVDTKFEQASSVMQTTHNNSVQGLRKTIMEVDSDIQILMRDTQNIHNALNTLTNLQNAKAAEQKNILQREEKISSALRRSERRGRSQSTGEQGALKFPNVSEQIARKISNVPLNAFQLTATDEQDQPADPAFDQAPTQVSNETNVVENDQPIQNQIHAEEAEIPTFPIEIVEAAAAEDEQHTGALHVPDNLLSDVIAKMQAERNQRQNEQKFAFDASERDAVSFFNSDTVFADSKAEESEAKVAQDLASAEKSTAHGPYSMSIEEVAEKFDTTIKVIETAIANGQLTMAKRGQNKILISSLQGFTPARKRRHRLTAQLETQRQEVSIF
jgi:hypothetical protein